MQMNRQGRSQVDSFGDLRSFASIRYAIITEHGKLALRQVMKDRREGADLDNDQRPSQDGGTDGGPAQVEVPGLDDGGHSVDSDDFDGAEDWLEEDDANADENWEEGGEDDGEEDGQARESAKEDNVQD